MHTWPMQDSGSSCADHHGSMTGGTVRALGSCVLSGRSPVDGTPRNKLTVTPSKRKKAFQTREINWVPGLRRSPPGGHSFRKT